MHFQLSRSFSSKNKRYRSRPSQIWYRSLVIMQTSLLVIFRRNYTTYIRGLFDTYFPQTSNRHNHFSSPLYFYIFSYMSELNKLRELSQAPASCPGAAHGDDLCYLFSSSFFNTDNTSKSSPARAYRTTMCKLWTNFAKLGTPTPDNSLGFRWSSVQEAVGLNGQFELHALDLNDRPTMVANPFAERFNFWKALFQQYNGSHLNIN
uniref:carboxylesterase n=1 Tax=Culex pipiens TaxID=7175 RepID=A0A8D8C2P0_CULPI